MSYLKQQVAALLTIDSPAEDVQRRGRSLVSIATVLLLMLIGLVLLWFQQGDREAATAGAICGGFFLTAILLARRGRVTLAAALFSTTISLAVLGLCATGFLDRNTPFYLLLPISAAALIFPSRLIWPMLALNILGLVAVATLVAAQHPLSYAETQALQDSIVLMIAVALAGALGARSIDRALAEAYAARREAQQIAADLDRANAALEVRIAERTHALADALDAQRTQASELQRSLERQQSLNDLVTTLALPIIPISDDVLVVPLVGAMADDRFAQLASRVLDEIEQRHARAIMLDLTGLALIDAPLVRTLVHVAASARLLGAQVVLAGIRPEMAQMLVSLNADLSGVQTVATLQSGLTLIAPGRARGPSAAVRRAEQ